MKRGLITTDYQTLVREPSGAAPTAVADVSARRHGDVNINIRCYVDRAINQLLAICSVKS